MGPVLALLLARLLPALGSQRSFLQIMVPWSMPSNQNGNLEQVSYIITIEERSYTLHLKQQVFLPSTFRVYTYSRDGAVQSDFPHIKRDCFYKGYVAGFPDSAVTLSTCSGLRGILQLKNVSYGIEPLDSTPGFQHLVYQIWNENTESLLFVENDSVIWSEGMARKLDTGIKSQQSFIRHSRYLEMYVILDKALYDYMGSEKDVVTDKIVQLIGFVNSMFTHLNMTIVLSSLEFWEGSNKIPTTGEADELLQRFLQWKNIHLTLRPHDIAYLFVYRDQPNYVGASFAGNLCLRNYSGGVALYQRAVTLETFSVIIAQLLGLSLGIAYDDSRDCQCPGVTCIMHTAAVHSSGTKAFSNCSIGDFQSFIANGEGECLLNKPYLNVSYKAPVCGNKIVEEGEDCDCGSKKECLYNKCCQHTCKFRRDIKCVTGDCCWACRFLRNGTLCRNTGEDECDLIEYCNGSSAHCTPDFWVLDGHPCNRNTGYCFKGVCQTADKQCKKIFGKASKSGSLACYEEINGQKDRMGHCGVTNGVYQTCEWNDLQCGKLVCQYPSTRPFIKEKAAVIYARVQNTLCVTLDYMKGPQVKDPMLVKDGTTCGKQKICMNQKCVDAAVLKYNCDVKKKCNDHGVCNNRGNCHCKPGWLPPNCKIPSKGFGGSIDSGFRSDAVIDRFQQDSMKNWLLLSFCLFLPVLVCSAVMIIKRNELTRCCAKEESQADELEDVDQSENPSV
ncbi:disintegrin and metalloproteinase domain-containing protein 32 isoform X1 [Pelodiscus sinensis]|uniref:disintegrin and metalloproteinase domain-containing protein 32 isoform X1 n=1 Tax=Pelodiscus sinensis TaxID=13735 RepID=UPI003F6C3A9A